MEFGEHGKAGTDGSRREKGCIELRFRPWKQALDCQFCSMQACLAAEWPPACIPIKVYIYVCILPECKPI